MVTEMETMQRAKMYLDKLAQGIDPTTNLEVYDDSVLNDVRIARCLIYVSDILGQVIANGGVVGTKSKKSPFSITPEQLSSVHISSKPIRITQLVDLISEAVHDSQMNKLSPTTITDWLLKMGFLEIEIESDGKKRRTPSENGVRIGITTKTRQGKYGEYQAVYYSASAQQFVLDHLVLMLRDL